MTLRHAAVCALVLVAACTVGDNAADDVPAVETDPQTAFWSALTELCGQAFEGEVTESSPPDTLYSSRTLVMHVRECSDDVIRIPFHVGDDRSRTWVLTRIDAGLRLKHDHRHEDGSEDAITQYGGDTAEQGSATEQSFPADAETAALLPAAATNVWTVEVVPGSRFAYALRREGTDRRFRAEFDLTQPVTPPPAPWGAADSTSAAAGTQQDAETALRNVLVELMRGPSDAERAAGANSWFSDTTADALQSVDVDAAGHATVAFADLRRMIPNASSSAGSAMLLDELKAAVFSVPAIQSVEYRIDGSCTAFWEWLQIGGCRRVTRGA